MVDHLVLLLPQHAQRVFFFESVRKVNEFQILDDACLTPTTGRGLYLAVRTRGNFF